MSDEGLAATRELPLSQQDDEARRPLVEMMPHSEIAGKRLAQLDAIAPPR